MKDPIREMLKAFEIMLETTSTGTTGTPKNTQAGESVDNQGVTNNGIPNVPDDPLNTTIHTQGPDNHVRLSSVLDDISSFLQRYIVFKDPAYPIVLSLWTAHTWVIEAFNFTPYIYVSSPTKRCGKSKVIDSEKLLCMNPEDVAGSSGPALYRIVDTGKPTLFCDEIDKTFSAKSNSEAAEAIQLVYNVGFERGRTVAKCVGTGSKIRVQKFSPFCPKLLAGINNGHLPDTILDRSLKIRMLRKSKTARVVKLRTKSAIKMAAPIVNALKEWGSTPSVLQRLSDAEPEMPESLDDRATDISEPLIAIADMAGTRWARMAREAIAKVCGDADEDESTGVMMLTAMYDIFTTGGVDQITSEDLLRKLITRDNEPWADWWEKKVDDGHTQGPKNAIAKIIKRFDIIPQKIRTGDNTAQGYKKEWFHGVFESYGLLSPLLSQNGGTSGTPEQSPPVQAKNVPVQTHVPDESRNISKFSCAGKARPDGGFDVYKIGPNGEKIVLNPMKTPSNTAEL